MTFEEETNAHGRAGLEPSSDDVTNVSLGPGHRRVLLLSSVLKELSWHHLKTCLDGSITHLNVTFLCKLLIDGDTLIIRYE